MPSQELLMIVTSDDKFRALLEAGSLRIQLRLQAQYRLRFARYLYATGRISDGVPPRRKAA